MQSKGLETRVRRPQFNFVATAENSFQSGAGLVDQCDNDLSVARFVATLDQRNVAIADVLVDHRVAFYSQRVDSLGANAAEKKTRHANRFRIFHRIDRNAGSDATNETNFAHSIGRHFFHAQAKFENSRLVFTLDQTTLLECRDVFGNGGF